MQKAKAATFQKPDTAPVLTSIMRHKESRVKEGDEGRHLDEAAERKKLLDLPIDQFTPQCVINAFVKSNIAATVAIKNNNIAVTRKLQKSQLIVAELTCEVDKLRKGLAEMEDMLQVAQQRSQLLEEENIKFKHESFIFYEKYAKLEVGYDKKLSAARNELSNVQNVVNEQQKRIAEMLSKLATLEQQKQATKMEAEEEIKKLNADKERDLLELQQKCDTMLQKKELELSELKAELQQKRDAADQQLEVITAYESQLQVASARQLQCEQELKELQEKVKEESGQLDQQNREHLRMEMELKSLTMEYDNLLKRSSADIKDLKQQLEDAHNEKQAEQAELQSQIQQKISDFQIEKEKYAEMERNKNSTIAELKYKMSQIGKAFEQPVGNARVMSAKTVQYSQVNAKEDEQPLPPSVAVTVDQHSASSDDTINKIAASVAAATSVPIKGSAPATTTNKRREVRNTFPSTSYVYNSDFQTDTDEYEPPTKTKLSQKRRRLNTKKLTGRNPQKRDVFDELKYF